jgi:phage-related protein
MVREVLFYGDYFWGFYRGQSLRVQDKIDWTLVLIADTRVVPEQYLKHLSGTDLYEIRVNVRNNIFRIFCFFDEGNLVVLLNGFQKKTEKTPRNEIEKAKRLKKQYYEDKDK